VGVHTGTRRSLGEIESIISRERAAHRERSERFGALAEIYEIVQTVMAWDTIYEPEQARVVSPVSRIWNIIWGGFGLFEWDNYFAAYLASLESREIAYVNAVEMTRCRTETGLVPNLAIVYDIKSGDRSEPPVGAFVVRELYRRYRDRWLLEMLYDDLLVWNRWWSEHRDWDGLLCWGSDPYEPVVGSDIELRCVHDREGSALESGLDNSPMFDDVPFDEQRNLMAQADVGLMGMYILDCEALADIARVLGKQDDVAALTARADRYRRALAGLWDEEHGVYWNRRMDSRQPNPRFGATCFYPLLGRVPTQAQAERLVREHFYNPGEFWGEWILPSISRNDAAYQDQNYWRGRIWPPMNFLVYLGLRNYALPEARADLVERSLALLLKEWRDRGHVHENYNANTGEGCDHHNSDAFYHWGALLGLMQLVEEGHVPAPEVPLS
jgi:hypothetical protein